MSQCEFSLFGIKLRLKFLTDMNDKDLRDSVYNDLFNVVFDSIQSQVWNPIYKDATRILSENVHNNAVWGAMVKNIYNAIPKLDIPQKVLENMHNSIDKHDKV